MERTSKLLHFHQVGSCPGPSPLHPPARCQLCLSRTSSSGARYEPRSQAGLTAEMDGAEPAPRGTDTCAGCGGSLERRFLPAPHQPCSQMLSPWLLCRAGREFRPVLPSPGHQQVQKATSIPPGHALVLQSLSQSLSIPHPSRIHSTVHHETVSMAPVQLGGE